MGCDIHLTIEQRDNDGAWNVIWDTGLQYSQWFISRYMEKGQNFYEDPHGLRGIKWRNYSLFSILSGVRGTNSHAELGIGSEEYGLLHGQDGQGWPDDISKCAQYHVGDGDLHSHGYALLSELIDIKNDLMGLDDEDDENIMQEREAFIRWVNDLEATVAKFTGPDALLKRVIGRLPHGNEYDDPDYPIDGAVSAHERVSNITGDKWSTLRDGNDNIRILVCYDN